MTAVPGLDSRSALAPPATVGASRDAGFGLVSQGGAVDSESAAIAMASLCLKAGLAPRPRSPGAAASASILVGYDIDCCINRLFILPPELFPLYKRSSVRAPLEAGCAIAHQYSLRPAVFWGRACPVRPQPAPQPIGRVVACSLAPARAGGTRADRWWRWPSCSRS